MIIQGDLTDSTHDKKYTTGFLLTEKILNKINLNSMNPLNLPEPA